MTDDCYLCGHTLSDALHVHDQGRTGPLTTVACSECSLLQTSPHPTAAEVEDYYRSGQYRIEFPALPRDELDAELQPTGRTVRPEDDDYADTLDRHGEYAARRLVDALGLGAGVRVLEVGCGDGRVAAAMRRLGVDVRAAEYDPRLAAEAVERGAVLAGLEDDGFDIAYALQVVEHFADPVGELEAMVRRVKVGGLVFVEVPTVERPYVSLSHFLQKPHVVNYSTHTLAAALRRAGLEEVHTAIDGSVLLGWGVRSANGPRAYEPHGGPLAPEVVGKLLAWERQRAATAAAERHIECFLDAEWRACVPGEGNRATLDFMADEFQRWRRMGSDAGVSLAKLCRMLEEVERPDWHADPWMRGFYAGRIYEGQRMGTALAHINNQLGLNLNKPVEQQ